MIAWINDRIKDNEGEEGHVIIHWLWHGDRTLGILGNYLFRQKASSTLSARFFPVRRWLKRRGQEEEELEEEEEVKEEMILQVEELVLPSLLGSRETTYNIL